MSSQNSPLAEMGRWVLWRWDVVGTVVELAHLALKFAVSNWKNTQVFV